MLFELFYIGFGQFIAALSPNDLFASLLVPAFFTFVVAFCGVVVPYRALPHFWQSWMYWLTPFHYLLEAFLGVVMHEVPMRCVEREESSFTVPPGQSCEGYAGGFVQQVGGYVRDVGGGGCAFCQYDSGDQFAASFNVFYQHKWRDYGIFFGYVIFNFIVVFIISWLYLHGIQDLKKWLSARKTRKTVKQ
jgi:ATP-binding cassette subfamily G (WHITE) protein 2 (SNQ2)